MRLALPPKSCKVYTPLKLASAMVRSLGDRPQLSWLEPSHGTGSFLEAMAGIGVSRERIIAIDLDPKYSTADNLATTFRGVDFLRWASETDRRFDRIVGNPPYVSISRLPHSLQRTAAQVHDIDSAAIGYGANVWYAFVLVSLRLLKPGGSLAFVLPSAVEFADYSAALRAAVRNKFARLELYTCRRPLFSEVKEGTTVAIARDFESQPFRVMRRRFDAPHDLMSGLARGQRLNGRRCPSKNEVCGDGTVRFSSIAHVGLGGVTGDAPYFLMNEERRRTLKLPARALVPVVSRARHLRSAFIDRTTWNNLKRNGERVWLFSPTVGIAKNVAVRRYLNLSLEIGGCNRQALWVAKREPWYRTSLPTSPDAFISGMCRHGPWLCINELPSLNATNTLYVVRFKKLDENEKYGYALGFLTSNVQRQLRRAGRLYADGLVKYEPSSLGALRLPKPNGAIIYRPLYENAVAALLLDKTTKAKSIADSAWK